MISGPFASRTSFLLCRVIVPLWVFTGATFKLVEGDPNNLPRGLLRAFHETGVADLSTVLWALISLEYLAVGVMLFMSRLARPMATFVLGVFCLVLLNELRIGNFTSCGCFGSIPIPPWAILIVDGLLLTGVVLLQPSPTKSPLISKVGLMGAASLAAALAIVSGIRLLGTSEIDDTVVPAENSAAAQNGTSPPTGSRPEYGPGLVPTKYVWVEEANVKTWAGEEWTSIEFARYMPQWPDPDFKGKWYIIFYSPKCEHCQELLNTNFEFETPQPTIVVAVPEGQRPYTDDDYSELYYCRDCVREMQLPAGQTWVVDFPIVVAIEDNIVKCAKSRVDAHGDNCLIWH